MTLNLTLAIAERVIRQILRDHRSIALIVVVPVVVMALVAFSFAYQPQVLDFVAPGSYTSVSRVPKWTHLHQARAVGRVGDAPRFGVSQSDPEIRNG